MNQMFGVDSKARSMLLSVLGFAAFLPILIAGVVNKGDLKFFAKADEDVAKLRIWFDPPAVVVAPGQEFHFSIMGEYRDKYGIIPQVTGTISTNSNLTLSSNKLMYSQAFSGTVKLGSVSGVENVPGVYYIQIPIESVKTIVPDLPIISARAEVLIR